MIAQSGLSGKNAVRLVQRLGLSHRSSILLRGQPRSVPAPIPQAKGYQNVPNPWTRAVIAAISATALIAIMT